MISQGGVLVEEMREGAAGFRQVQEWVAEGRFPEAILLLEELLTDPALGRSKRVQLHSLACWLYDGPLQQSGPRAVLHGEEAIRLAEALHDPWHRAEAQAHLAGARIHMGDLVGARAELGRLEADLAESPGLLSDGERTLFILNLLFAAACGDWERCRALLCGLEPQRDAPELELIRAWANLRAGMDASEVRLHLPPSLTDPVLLAERALLETHLDRVEGAPVDRSVVSLAMLRLSAAGRRDLIYRLSLAEAPVDVDGNCTRGKG